MINITSITRQMLWAFVAVMAATGEASPQTALAVIAKGGIPYYASIQDVGIAPPLGQFAASAHLCMKNAVVTWNGRKFLQFYIQSRGAVYAAFNLEAVFRNPAADRDCELMAQQGNSSTEPTSADSAKAGSLEDGIAAGDRGDWKAAFVLLEPLAKQGNPDAQNRIGYMYAYSQGGVPQDYTEAMKWWRKAASQGSAKAQTNIGFMYENGHGVLQDYAEAMKWYRKAAEQGIAAAQSNIGAMYANGKGVPQDYAEATKWYRKAADQGNAVAQNNIGYMYANGLGVPQDHTEAIKWWRKAADQGNADAQNNLRTVSTREAADQVGDPYRDLRSAHAPLAVIVQAGFPYYASPQDVFSKPPLGQFAFNVHLCEKQEMPILNHVQFLQFILPSGDSVYSEYTFQGAVIRDPAGDNSCMSQVASTALPANTSPSVQRAPQPVHNSVTPPTMAASGKVLAQTSSPAIGKLEEAEPAPADTAGRVVLPGTRVKVADAQSSPPLNRVTQESNVQTVVSLLWQNILTKCPVKGSSPLDYSYFYTDGSRQGRVLYEYREPADFQTMIQADRLSTADELNGIEWRGTAIWSAGAYRTREDSGAGWSEWKGMENDDIDASQVLSSLGSGTLAGNLLFFMEKKHGQWSISIGSIGLLGLTKRPFDPDEYWSAQLSCGIATSAGPFKAAPLASGATPPPSAGPVGDQNYAKLVEDLIEENAKTWMMNRFVSGSVTSVAIASNDGSNKPAKLQAHYLFNGFSGRSDGSVTITFMDGLPECLYFFDFPNTCKSPSRRVVTAYAQGEYRKK